jgi:hypothetical protein
MKTDCRVVLPARARRPPITLRKTSIWGPQRAKKDKMKQIQRMIKPQKSMAAAALPHAARQRKRKLLRRPQVLCCRFQVWHKLNLLIKYQ